MKHPKHWEPLEWLLALLVLVLCVSLCQVVTSGARLWLLLAE